MTQENTDALELHADISAVNKVTNQESQEVILEMR